MCFSATASFITGTALAAIGVVAFTKAKTVPGKVFGVIPFIFSVQQLTEGVLWLSIPNEQYAAWREPAMYFFLFFAQVLWPIWVPLTMWLLEKDMLRRKIMSALLVIGVLVSAELAYNLIHGPVYTNIMGHHVMYNIYSPWLFKSYLNPIFYCLATVLPPFLSSVKKVWWLGVALVVSYIIARIYYPDYVASVWCYFAATISGAVIFIIWETEKLRKLHLHLKVD